MTTKRRRLGHVLCLAVLCATGFGGCRDDKGMNTPPAAKSDGERESRMDARPPAPRAGDDVLDTAVSLWNQGQQDKAVDALLRIAAPGAAAYSQASVFATSASDLNRLAQAEQTEKRSKILQDTKTLKQICKLAVDKGMSVAGKGDVATTEKLFSAVEECGRAIAGPDRITNLDGVAIQKLALKNLQQLYERSGDKAKLQKVQQRLSGQ